MPTPNISFPSLVERSLAGRDASVAESESAFRAIMAGEASDAEIAGWLIALRAKGESPLEVAGGVRALRGAMVRVPIPDPGSLVDTAGTGGGSVRTFNISTAAAFVAAGVGVRMAKHGNRSFTSKCGSADVLEALGVRIDLRPTEMAEVIETAGMVFMFAPNLHPAMRHVAPVRRALGVATVMNLLGPLTNPAGARRQVVGVSDRAHLGLVAGALAELGHERAMVVHGEPGMDEVSPCGPTHVAEVCGGSVKQYDITPAELGVPEAAPDDLVGGGPAENADAVKAVLAGETGARRSAVVINSAAAVWAAGRADTLAEATTATRASIDEGRARDALERLIGASVRAVGPTTG